MSGCLASPSILSFTELATTLFEVQQAHAYMLKTGVIQDTFAASRLVTFATTAPSCPQTVDYAHSIFTRITTPNSYVWNTIIRAYANGDSPENALLIFRQMLLSPVLPDKFTFPFVLKACSYLHNAKEGEQIHAHILKIGLGSDVFIQNTLIHMYASIGHFDCAHNLLGRMLERNVISWNAIISAYAEWGLMEPARCLFDEMLERNVESWNFMISGYVSLGLIEEARVLFDEMPLRDVVSWNAMITGYAHESLFSELLVLFEEMQNTKVKPNNHTLVSVLSACAGLGALSQGEWVHAYIDKNGIKIDGFLSTALVDMYSKCGNIEKALHVFTIAKEKDVSTWNSVIAGLSTHGCGKHALALFSEMLAEGFTPNEVTFISVLSACSHTGLLEEGRRIFDIMVKVHGIQPTIEHRGCMIDLLGRVGLLEEAEELATTIPVKEAPMVFESLLGACRNHGNVKLAEHIVRKLLETNPQDSASYVQLSNIYAYMERWEDVREVRRKMKAQNVRKEPGRSIIEVDGVIHEFLAGDGLHS